MTPFKERMNLYRTYREQNPDKNYWDWKQSLEVPSMWDGGETRSKPKSISQAIAEAKEVEERVLSGQLGNESYPFEHELDFSDENVTTPFADAASIADRNARSFSNGMQKLAIQLREEKEEQLKQDIYNYKLMANSLATAAELGSGMWMLGKGANAVNLLPQRFGRLYNSDVAQVTANTIGTAADAYQLFTADTSKEILENSIELPADVAGVIGGTNIVRNTPWFGRYGNTFDNVLDALGYGAATYDVLIKPGTQLIQHLSNDEDVPTMQNGGNTVEDYITQQIQNVREKAYQNSLSRTMPRVPYQGGQKNTISKEQFEADKIAKQTSLQQQLDSLPKQLNPATGQYSTSLMYKHVEDALTKQLAEVNASAYQDTNNGAILPSCIYTATDNYGEQYLQPSTVVFMQQAGKNGFREIPIGDVKKGDIVIRSKNGQNHGMLFDGYDAQGRRLYNHSNGGHTAEAIRKHAKYPATDDMLRAYEFVGTAKDSARWISEYEKLQGIVPAMQNGGENEPLQDPTIKTITFPDGSTVQTVQPWANQQGLQNTPIADMFNPANDVYDLVQVGKDATEGNWAGVGAGLVIAAMPKWMETIGGAVKSGVKKLIRKARNSDNADWGEVVSGLAVPVKKDPMGVDAKPISDEIKFDNIKVAGLSGETSPRYLDYGNVEFQDHIGYMRPQWLKDVQEFYNTDVAARERAMATREGYFYYLPPYLQRSDLTFNTRRPVNIREYLDDVDYGGYANDEKIVMVRGTGMNPDDVLAHEGAHWDQSNVYHDLPFDGMRKMSDAENTVTILQESMSNKPVDRKYKRSAQTLLDNAYTFTEDFLQKHSIYETLEKGATNREMRYAIWKAAGKPNPDKLDEIIDNMSDDDIIYQLTQTNGYSKDWHKNILESGTDRKKVADAIRKALKYVPAAMPAVGVVSAAVNSTEKEK